MNPFLKLLLHNFFKNYKINKHTKFMLLYKHGCEKRYTHCYKNNCGEKVDSVMNGKIQTNGFVIFNHFIEKTGTFWSGKSNHSVTYYDMSRSGIVDLEKYRMNSEKLLCNLAISKFNIHKNLVQKIFQYF